MGDVWAGLYLLAFVLPALVLAGSSYVVFRLATRIQTLGQATRPRWQYLILHLVLGLGLALPLGPIAALAWLIVPGYLYRILGRARHPDRDGQPASAPLVSAPSGQRRWGLALLFTATGVLLPWATGLGVKLYLDSLGRPTLPLAGFLDPTSIAVELLLTLGAWAFPFLLLASAVVVPWRVGFPVDSDSRNSLLPIWLAYTCGALATVPVFAGVFWEFDSMMLLVPVGLVLVPPMALGYFIGWWWLRRTNLEKVTHSLS